jgi:pyruvate/2-oxoglutarate dehydrogenase complex dihydrolipoamide acyltransferase (E2) component
MTGRQHLTNKEVVMKQTLAILAVVALAACSDPTPPPAAKKAEPAAPAPQAKAPEAPQPAPKAEEPKPDPDKALAARVKRALQDDNRILAQGIDVSASNGAVTLWGTTATAAERNRAGATAAKVQGVTTVENKLAIVKGS